MASINPPKKFSTQEIRMVLNNIRTRQGWKKFRRHHPVSLHEVDPQQVLYLLGKKTTTAHDLWPEGERGKWGEFTAKEVKTALESLKNEVLGLSQGGRLPLSESQEIGFFLRILFAGHNLEVPVYVEPPAPPKAEATQNPTKLGTPALEKTGSPVKNLPNSVPPVVSAEKQNPA